MQELRLVAVSEDGTYLVLASAGRGTRFTLPVDDRLRAAVRGQFSRLGQYEIEVENPLRPKEIQARIRSGETAEAIAEAAGIPIERVRWFEGPVLQEREYMAQQAQRATVRRQGESGPGPVLGDLVADRIGRHQLETGDAVWDSWKRDDGSWLVKLAFLIEGEERVAHWTFDPRRRYVSPADDEAARFSTPEPEEPLDLGADTGGGTVTPFVPRRQGAYEPAVRPEPAAPAPAAPAEPVRAEPAGGSGRVPVTAASERGRPTADPATHRVPEPSNRPDPAPAADPDRASAAAQRTGPPGSARPSQEEPPLSAAAAGGVSGQPPRRKSRGRRASVPSWDEIMFGAKKTD
ncbi:septation protein SepH [Marinactinospora rubrisoli]|uniref:Septation protein SepH n=1 Tax=Marinactinospora rubrisoli TaxID=2715399 RepID=A0ABW2KDH8_9ACTN